MTDTDTDTAAAPAGTTIHGEETIRVVYVNPAELVMDDNLRADAAATVTPEFVRKIKATKGNKIAGVVTVLSGQPGSVLDPEVFRLAYGFRRAHACILAGEPYKALVAGPDGDDQTARRARILDQLTENDGRLDLAPSEVAAALLTLFDTEGMTVAGIAKATGRAKPEVTAALAVARSAEARHATDHLGLDLIRSAALAGFEGDDEATAALLAAAGNGETAFDQVAARMRASADERLARREFTAALAADGVRVWDMDYLPWLNRLTSLRTPGGGEITPDEHRACDGHRAVISYEWYWPETALAAWRDSLGAGPDDELPDFAEEADALEAGMARRWEVVEYMCEDPDAGGHVSLRDIGRPAEVQASLTEAEEADARRRAYRYTRVGNTQWRAAREVRLEALTRLCARKTPPKGTLKKILAALARADWDLITALQKGNHLAAKLLGADTVDTRADLGRMVEAASDNRAQVIGLAVLLGAAEAPLEDDHTWRADADWRHNHLRKNAGPYLAALRDWLGFELTPIEAAVADGDESYDPLAGEAAGAGQDGITPAAPELDPVTPPAAQADTGQGAAPGDAEAHHGAPGGQPEPDDPYAGEVEPSAAERYGITEDDLAEAEAGYPDGEARR